MNQHRYDSFPKKRDSFLCFLVTILLALAVSGCVPASAPVPGTAQTTSSLPEAVASAPSMTEAVPSTEDTSALPDPEADRQMKELADQIFQNEISRSSLTLHYTLAYPESYGITDYEIGFGHLTESFLQESYERLKKDQAQLHHIKPEQLSPDLQLLYYILDQFFQTQLEGEPFAYYDQPLSSTIGIQAQMPFILAEYVFYRTKDVEEYLQLLSQIDEYFEEIIQYEQKRTELGLCLSDREIDHIIDSCRPYLESPETGLLAQTFEERLEQLPDISPQERHDYLNQNRQLLQEDFSRAYRLLIDGLTELKGNREASIGLFYLPNGQDYYWYLLQSSTGTSYDSPEALAKAIQTRMSRDILELGSLLTKQPEIETMFSEFQFSLTEPEPILEDLKMKISEDFPEIPECHYTISYVPEALEDFLSPAFYLTSPIDRYDENSIYINRGSNATTDTLYTTLAHEGFPGHLYQNVYFNAMEQHPLRYLLSFPSYTEGWATYAEHLAFSWDHQADANLSKALSLNSSAYLALYAMLDYHLHYEGWDFDQMTLYLTDNFGISDEETLTLIYDAIIENPTNYMEYYVGYLEICNMKNLAQKRLDEDFDLKEFHRFLLDIGPAPFPVIREYLDQWIAAQE